MANFLEEEAEQQMLGLQVPELQQQHQINLIMKRRNFKQLRKKFG
jgi:hypothetical protein